MRAWNCGHVDTAEVAEKTTEKSYDYMIMYDYA